MNFIMGLRFIRNTLPFGKQRLNGCCQMIEDQALACIFRFFSGSSGMVPKM